MLFYGGCMTLYRSQMHQIGAVSFSWEPCRAVWRSNAIWEPYCPTWEPCVTIQELCAPYESPIGQTCGIQGLALRGPDRDTLGSIVALRGLHLAPQWQRNAGVGLAAGSYDVKTTG
jgi:hypothetical protein